ncbi:MAG: response regulator [Dehalococcoidia bacterium]
MSGEVILVVEDNPMNSELVADLLAAAGYKVVPADTAEEGLTLAESAHPNLILMDISLPGMDGLEAARVLKRHPETGNIPIVALTAHAMNGDEAAALAAGCNGYITKPINTRTFVGTVESFIEAA